MGKKKNVQLKIFNFFDNKEPRINKNIFNIFLISKIYLKIAMRSLAQNKRQLENISSKRNQP
jgi:hypothetical protein